MGTDLDNMSPKILKILINKNVDLNQSDYTGRTIKDIAKNSRDKRILKLLN